MPVGRPRAASSRPSPLTKGPPLEKNRLADDG